MSIRLICDFCRLALGEEPKDLMRHGRGMVELRGITDTNIGEIHRSDYPYGQVHWECIVPFVERENSRDAEPPF